MTQLGRDELLRAYRTMKTIREFEERVHFEFETGDVPGFVHLYAGEEACAAGVCMHLSEGDRITSTHRGHGHCIAKGVDVHAMMAEIFGKKTGVCHGKGGSMHIADLDKGMMGANGIVGGGPPLACGAALTFKVQGNDNVAIAFVGDGGSNQGTTFESLNLAKVWNLPAVFVAENNGYAEATSSSFSVGAESIADRASSFGMPAVVVDGHDFFAVYEAAGEAVQRAREGGGPSFIECQVNRYFGHYEGDAQTYRGTDEVERLRETRDCIAGFATSITETAGVDESLLEAIDSEVALLIESSVAAARSDPKPQPGDLLTDVYVSY
jgi:pyruvate dehydrogenase E1 component alpha subunit